ncbi:MAG: cobalt-precorrin-6A reductase [Proteobacteria bacterium]|nr:cobalt-precorrin-6A reductase [Pseudomonadota bacterium]
MTTILMLGGTAEAVTFARCLAGKFDVIYSLAGRTRTPTLPDCALRVGGFGGVDGLMSYVRETGISAIVDVTHPFAAQMAANARAAAALAGVPLFKFLRPAWDEPSDAPWLHAATASDAARIIDGRFGRVFLSSGLGDIAAFAPLSTIWFLVRSVDPSNVPAVLAQHHHLTSRGPFDLAAETALLSDWHIDALVSKNSGGQATIAKLHAARALGIPVVMIDRPPVPPGNLYTDIATARHAIRRFFQ